MASVQQNLSINVDDNSSRWFKAIERLKFQERICKTFIPQEINENCCVCNGHHPKNETPKPNEVWNRKDHTEPKQTQCYGIFPYSTSPYLRCDIETNLEELCLVLLGMWCRSTPGLIMRMIGDAASTLNIKLEKELLQGLSDAATASDAWIITSGYKEEAITELIGEIVYKNRIKNAELNFNAIAVGKWGNIKDCRTLPRSDQQSNKYDRSGGYTLEPNHTHYIFFDDGTYDSIDTGGFASKLARQLSREGRRRIPLITILVGGNLYALKSIWNDLINEIPVVIIHQSGSLATILCKYLKTPKSRINQNQDYIDDESGSDDENDIDIFMLDHSFAHINNKKLPFTMPNTLREALRPFGKMRLDIYKDLLKLYRAIRQEQYKTTGKKLPTSELLSAHEKKTLAKYFFWFATCLTSPLRNNVHVYDYNSSISLQNMIYNASVQARNNLAALTNTHGMTIDEQICQALHWSIPDITGDQLLATTMNWNDSTKIEQNRKLLLDGLSKNLPVFVRNFIQLDIDLSILFAPVRKHSREENWFKENWSDENSYLKELYSESRRKIPDPLYLLDEVDQTLDFKKESDLNIVLKTLVDDSMNALYMKPTTLIKLQPWKILSARNPVMMKRDVEYIYRDIFLWCVLTYRLSMAKIILSQMKTRICSALIAIQILKSLRRFAPDQEAKDKLYSEANVFETYAIEFVRCSYLYNKRQACELIVRQVHLYEGVTCLQMAIVADAKKFLYEDACQALLTNIWYDKIDPVREQTRLLVHILTLGISQMVISIYDKHSEKNRRAQQKIDTSAKIPSKRRLERHGIDYSDDYGIDESILRHFWHFHNRPIVKYAYTCFGYCLFLIFFSYYMLYAFDMPSDQTPAIHWTEILTIIIVTTMLFEEVRQFYMQDNRTWRGKFLTYFDLTNRTSNLFLVLPAYLLFYIGLILRFTLKDITNFSAARIVMAYDLELWFIRAVLFVGIVPELGPKLVMIRKMTSDLLLFIIIIVVFIFGYGITSRAMTAYGTFDFNGRQFFRNVVYPVYYFVLGSFDNELSQLDETPDASTSIATQVMFAFHMLFVNILLLNLLIALFSNTVNDVETQAHYIWAYDRCTLIRDYYGRPALFPPFTFVVSMIEIGYWCYRWCRSNQPELQCFKMIPKDLNLHNTWSEFERFSTNDSIRQLLDVQTNTTANSMIADFQSDLLPTSTDESKRLKSDMNEIKEELTRSRTDTSNRLSSVESTVFSLQYRVDRMMSQMASVQESLNWMMRAMARVKMDKNPPLLVPNPRGSVSNQGHPELSESMAENQRTSTRVLPFSQSQRNRGVFTISNFLQSSEDRDDA